MMSEQQGIHDHDFVESEWSKDVTLFQDETKIAFVSTQVPFIHSKYLKIYDRCLIKSIRMKSQLEQMELFLESYFAGTAEYEEVETWSAVCEKRGVMLPDLNRKTLKSDIPKRISSFPLVVEDKLRLAMVIRTADYTKFVLDQLNSMSFHIRNAIEYIKIRDGIK